MRSDYRSAATGHVGATFSFVNHGPSPCTLYGWPGFSMLDGGGAIIGAPAARCDGAPAGTCFGSATQKALAQVLLQPGAAPPINPAPGSTLPPGSFLVMWTDNCAGGASPTAPASWKIYPPDETGSITIPAGAGTTACSGSLEIYPVQP